MSFVEHSNGLGDLPGVDLKVFACDVRGKQDGRLDSVVISPRQGEAVPAAGVFTRNRMRAAPVVETERILAEHGKLAAIFVNSGNANACTGVDGYADVSALQEAAAQAANCEAGLVAVCSTGRIGRRLPIERMCTTIGSGPLVTNADASPGLLAAKAILTSDTREKVCTFEVSHGEAKVRIAAMAKGAGMIQPNMATMLAFIGTDAQVPPGVWQEILRAGVQGSFNAITVDGDESTNDTVLAFSTGTSGVNIDPKNPGLLEAFRDGLTQVCCRLARTIVSDGEKTTRVVQLRVTGAASAGEAEAAARAVGNSLLVKSSWAGGDPNWGRIADALGYSGARLEPGSVVIAYREEAGSSALAVYDRGTVNDHLIAQARKIVSASAFSIEIELGQGNGSYSLLATDLTEGYVRFNLSE